MPGIPKIQFFKGIQECRDPIWLPMGRLLLRAACHQILNYIIVLPMVIMSILTGVLTPEGREHHDPSLLCGLSQFLITTRYAVSIPTHILMSPPNPGRTAAQESQRICHVRAPDLLHLKAGDVSAHLFVCLTAVEFPLPHRRPVLRRVRGDMPATGPVQDHFLTLPIFLTEDHRIDTQRRGTMHLWLLS
ncbi:hypothetical protein C8J57DRAFT_1493106 [Mycena rebaudengoi]|nr:hypothetical protein C8J57DRAFT_1493106 [Mycena rebaudengoi]